MSFPLRALTLSALTVLTPCLAGCYFLVPTQPYDPADPRFQNAQASDPNGPPPSSGPSEPEASSSGGGFQSPPKQDSPPPPPSKPIPISVQIRSECSKTVPVFYGEKPGFSSGTRSSVSGNSISSQGRKSDGTLTVWLLDAKDNGITSVRVSPDTNRVIVDRSCTGLRTE
ncbi:hypothetical protein [Chondromyces apiculatus]|uniref:Lipoprotein n=1 Tax=Chondromyces apiculatus DSM 436 TaxID=1192034 RepID=A0A017TCZ0_9BACT|nr:hypothetical protein [Chondromyces apiculatus]EYF07148.1 Hypothetical protein CAP_0627 [Chondromyces apiculatus DSM 436]